MLDARNNPIIFPLLAHRIVRQYGVIIKGRRRSDFKLAEVLLKADENELPDVMFYKPELREWISVCEPNLMIKVMDDVVCDYRRHTKHEDASMLLLFHNIYSSAELGSY